MAQSDAPLAKVDGWWKKSSELANRSGDAQHRAATFAFDAMAAVLSKNHKQTRRALAYLSTELSHLRQINNSKNDSNGDLMHGILECVHSTLSDVTHEWYRVKEIIEKITGSHEESTQSHVEPLISSLVPSQPIRSIQIPMKPSNVTQPIPDDNQITALNFMGDDMTNDRGPSLAEENGSPLNIEDEITTYQKIERPSSSLNNQYLLDDSDQDTEPSVKKSRTESERGVEHGTIRNPPATKKNDSDLNCIECEYRTRSVCGWMNHLRFDHSTTPALSGLALLCGCGQESLSDWHTRICPVGHTTTVVRKRDEPIRRLTDVKATPKCILCEVYPKTAQGYIAHLKRHHHTTPIASEIVLTCSCGMDVLSELIDPNHSKECDRLRFSVHKLYGK